MSVDTYLLDVTMNLHHGQGLCLLLSILAYLLFLYFYGQGLCLVLCILAYLLFIYIYLTEVMSMEINQGSCQHFLSCKRLLMFLRGLIVLHGTMM